MTTASSLRGFPPLLPPSKPKKSPRLIPRPRGRRSSFGKRFSLSRIVGRENNEGETDPDAMTGVASLFEVGPQVSGSLSVPSSPLTFRGDMLKVTTRTDDAPLSPSSTDMTVEKIIPECNHEPKSSFAKVSSEKATVDDAPLTPRNLLQNTVALPQHALETPPFQQALLVVSAKRNGKEVKKSASQAKRRRRRSFEDMYTDSSDDDDDDLKQLQLPEDLSPGERTKEYWKQCYGSLPSTATTIADSSWSAARAAPAKGCLSVSKPKQQLPAPQMFFNASMSVSFTQSPPPNGLAQLSTGDGSPLFSTPKTSPTDDPPMQMKISHSKHVQFGCAEAMEYELDAPSAKFTPLPPELAKQRFPLEKSKSDQEQQDEEEEIADTKENSAVLREWEDDFDMIVAEAEDEEDQCHSKKKRSKRKHKNKWSNNRRRSSSFFSPSNSRSLLSRADQEEAELESPSATSNSVMVNTLASLTMASPASPPLPVTIDDESKCARETQQKDAMHTPFSPVVARRLSADSRSGISLRKRSASSENMLCFEHAIQDTDAISKPDDDASAVPSKCANGHSSSVTRLARIKAETLLSSSSLNLSESREHWNAQFVLRELASFGNIWDMLRSQPTARDADIQLQFLPGCFDDEIRDSLELIRTKIVTIGVDHLATASEFDPLDDALLHDWEFVAEHEWEVLQLNFLAHLTQRLDSLRKEVEAKCFGLETFVFPAEASLAPSKIYLEQTENVIRELEVAIEEEKHRKYALELQNMSTQLKRDRVAHHSSGLAAFAMDNILSPLDVAMSGHQLCATFTHVVEGMQTNYIANEDGSSEIVVNHSSENLTLASIGRHQIAAKFHNALLCTSDGSAFQNVLEPPVGAELKEAISHLSVVTGRIDLAALGLCELAKLYTVRVKTVLELDHPVVVVSVDLARNMSIRALYRRNDPQSVYLSRPCRFYIEQDGQHVTDPELLTLAIQLGTSSSLEACFGALAVVCEAALKRSE